MTAITPADCNKYITAIRINFENAYKTQTDEERQILIKSWFEILKDYPKEIVDKAVLQAIKHAEYAPRIGAIVKEIERMREAYEKSDTELWAELTGSFYDIRRHAARLSATYVREDGYTQGDIARMWIEYIYNNLSPELKEYCRTHRELIELADYDAEAIRYEKARFMRVIPTIKKRARTRQETGENLAGLIQGLSGKLAFDCDDMKLLKGD